MRRRLAKLLERIAYRLDPMGGELNIGTFATHRGVAIVFYDAEKPIGVDMTVEGAEQFAAQIYNVATQSRIWSQE
jgi:hypothetical protein